MQPVAIVGVTCRYTNFQKEILLLRKIAKFGYTRFPKKEINFADCLINRFANRFQPGLYKPSLKRVEPVAIGLNSVFENTTGSDL